MRSDSLCLTSPTVRHRQHPASTASLLARNHQITPSPSRTRLGRRHRAPLRISAAADSAGALSAEFAYWTGVAYAGLGDNAKAVESWKKGSAALAASGTTAESAAGGGPPVTWGSSAVGAGRGFGSTAGLGAQYYFQALCYQKLGQDDKARQLLNSLLESGQRGLKQLFEPRAAEGPGRRFGRPQSPRLREADAHFTVGLAYLGLNNLTQAKAELTLAVKTSPDLLGARVALASLN